MAERAALSPRARYGLALGGVIGFTLVYGLSGLMGWPLPTYDPVAARWLWQGPGDVMWMRYYGQIFAGLIGGGILGAVGAWWAPRLKPKAPVGVWWVWTAVIWMIAMLAVSLWV